MKRTALLFAAIVYVLIGAAAVLVSSTAVDYLEQETERKINVALRAAGQDWALIRSDGLRVKLSGQAPDESQRMRTLEVVGKLVDSDRVLDESSVVKSQDIPPPRFSLEVLRNESRVSLIGLVPTDTGRNAILQRLLRQDTQAEVTDMLEVADYPVPARWDEALRYALDSMAELPRSKISVTPELIKVTAVTDSEAEQAKVIERLKSNKPDNIELELEISAPRPVISPFRFLMSLQDEEFEVSDCSADTEYSKRRIQRALEAAGHVGETHCNVGLGIPTPDWTDAVIMSVEAVVELGGGTLTFTDTDISLVADEDTGQSTFDAVAGRLESDLPELFSLSAIIPPKPMVEGGEEGNEPPEFVVTRSPEGLVQLQGRLPDELIRISVGSVANSLFGHDAVFNQARVSEDLPEGWPMRVLAGLEGLSHLHHGTLIVRPEFIVITGVSADPQAQAAISGVLTDRVGSKGDYRLDVTFDESLVPKDETIDPKACESQISEVLKNQQIVFAPSSSEIAGESLPVISDIADILRECDDVQFVIEGHTDSQGREEMNKNLSQSRAESVLSALLSRRIVTSGLTAMGYGEEQPIADNSTEEGRAANRRIAFRLVLPEPGSETDLEHASGHEHEHEHEPETEIGPEETASAEDEPEAEEEQTDE